MSEVRIARVGRGVAGTDTWLCSPGSVDWTWYRVTSGVTDATIDAWWRQQTPPLCVGPLGGPVTLHTPATAATATPAGEHDEGGLTHGRGARLTS